MVAFARIRYDTKEMSLQTEVASIAGWKDFSEHSGRTWGWSPGSPSAYKPLPDFEHDLNAWKEIEVKLDDKYWVELMEIMNPGATLWKDGCYVGTCAQALDTCKASATDKCRALLNIHKL
jgi:hypothetical protein